MKKKNISIIIMLLFGFIEMYPASEPAPDIIQSTQSTLSFAELKQQLPEAWLSAEGLLFVNATSGVSAFVVLDDGGLIKVPGSPFMHMGGDIALSNNGNKLFVSNTRSNNVTVFTVADDGRLTQIQNSPFDTGGIGPSNIALSHDNKKLFVPNFSSNNISVFTVADDGLLNQVPGSPFATGGTAPNNIVLSHDNKKLIVSNLHSNDISVFTIADNGSLVQVQNSPFTTGGTRSTHMALSSDSRKLFVSNTGSNNITVFAIADNGRLTQVQNSPFNIVEPDNILLSSDDRKLFVLSEHEIEVFTIADDGGLTQIHGSPFDTGGTDAEDIILSSDGEKFFVTNTNSHDISVFIVAGDGRLTQVPGSPFDADGIAPTAMALNKDKNSQKLFVASGVDNEVLVFSVSNTGILTRTGTLWFGRGNEESDVRDEISVKKILFSPLPQKWRELQAIEVIRSLNELQEFESVSEYLPTDLEELMARMTLGEDINLTNEMRFNIYVYKHGLNSVKLDHLIPYLVSHHHKKGQPSPFGFMVPRDGTLTTEGFKLLKEWAKNKSPEELGEDINEIIGYLQDQNIEPIKRDVLNAMKVYLEGINEERGDEEPSSKRRRLN